MILAWQKLESNQTRVSINNLWIGFSLGRLSHIKLSFRAKDRTLSSAFFSRSRQNSRLKRGAPRPTGHHLRLLALGSCAAPRRAAAAASRVMLVLRSRSSSCDQRLHLRSGRLMTMTAKGLFIHSCRRRPDAARNCTNVRKDLGFSLS
jgi:hypothetical protein